MAMRTTKNIRADLSVLCMALEKYRQISRMPMDFGVGEPLFPAEIHVVSAVAGEGAMSVTDIARRFGNTKGAASQLVARLEAKGLLAKEADPAKGSRRIVRATQRGKKAHEAHLAFHERHDGPFRAYLMGLDESGYQCFSELCTRMNEWMGTYLEVVSSPKPKEWP